jgi:hypothetical protein
VTVELILQLALQAAEDPTACPVLGDALLEYGAPLELATSVFNLTSNIEPPIRASEWTEAGCEGVVKYFHDNAVSTTPTFARALYAAIMCSEWQNQPWAWHDGYKGRIRVQIPLNVPALLDAGWTIERA